MTYETEYQELQDKRAALERELDTHSHGSAAAADGIEERSARLKTGITRVNDKIKILRAEERERQVARVKELASDPRNLMSGDGALQPGLETGGGRDRGSYRDRIGGEVRDKARRALDALARSSERLETTDDAIQKVTRAMDGHDGCDVDVVGRWTAAVADPDYETAFTKLARDPQSGHREFTDQELKAYQTAKSVQRAMSLTDSAGGFLVPFQLDPSVILTSAGSASPIRRIARVVTATGDVWNGVSSAGVTASWDPEAQEVSDDAPTLAQPSIPVYRNTAFVPISIEASMDAQNVAQEVARLLVDGKVQLENTAFISGTGSAQPTGITTALDGTASDVPTATADVLTATDLYNLQSALPPRFQPNAQWAMSLATINDARQFETLNGSREFPELRDGRLLNRPLNESSHLDAAGDTATAGNDYVAVYGEWENFVVADRIGTVIEPIMHLFGAAQRPTGQRGFFLYARTGSDSVNDAAFRMLVA